MAWSNWKVENDVGLSQHRQHLSIEISLYTICQVNSLKKAQFDQQVVD